MFRPSLAIVRKKCQDDKGITFHVLFSGTGCYYSIIDGLAVVTDIKSK
jgi:hypothetical protein